MVKNRSLKTGFCLLTVSWRTIIDPRAVQYVFNWHWVISSPRKLVVVLAVIISLILLPRSGQCDGLTQRDFQWSFLSVLEVTELNPLFSIRTMRILVVEERACHIDSVLIISNLRFSFSLSKDTLPFLFHTNITVELALQRRWRKMTSWLPTAVIVTIFADGFVLKFLPSSWSPLWQEGFDIYLIQYRYTKQLQLVSVQQKYIVLPTMFVRGLKMYLFVFWTT